MTVLNVLTFFNDSKRLVVLVNGCKRLYTLFKQLVCCTSRYSNSDGDEIITFVDTAHFVKNISMIMDMQRIYYEVETGSEVKVFFLRTQHNYCG